MTTTGTCDNPLCTCSPCSCTECRCGTARIGDLERRVMEILWERADGEATVRDVVDDLPGYAYTTVATVLGRLAGKGLVRRRQKGRAIHFTPTGSRATHTAVLMRDALEASGDRDAALVGFAHSIPPAEAALLRRALDEVAGEEVVGEERKAGSRPAAAPAHQPPRQPAHQPAPGGHRSR